MTRILAFADTQLGVPTVDLQDQRDVLDKIVQVALEREVDAVLHGGDVFEGAVVTPEQLRTFIDAVRPLHEARVPLLAIRGNGRHDMAVREVNALDVLREVAGIQICDSPSISVLADKLVVCAVPWVHPGRLIAQSNGSLTHDEANLTTSQMLVKIAAHLHEKAQQVQAGTFGPANLPTVLLAHWALSGSALPTGLPVDEMREPILSWPDLNEIGFDAIIGAHIHQPQQISKPEIDSTLGIVCGSPQQLNHGETGEHGCWIIELDGEASAEFVPIESRLFDTFELNVDYMLSNGYEEGWSRVEPGTIARVRYEATEDQARRLDHGTIRALLLERGASRVTIEPQIIRKERARAQQINEQLGPLEALAAYCDSQDMPTDLSLRMLERLKEWNDG